VAATLSNVLLVNKDVPAKDVKELIALAKQKDGELTYGTPGIGTSPHMSMELLKSLAGVELRHIPYRGTAPAVTDLIGGRITATFANMLTAKPPVDGNQVRALAVSGGKRSAAMPNLPTVAEAGVPGYEAVQWYGLLAPAGTPEPIIARLHAEVVKILQLPETKDKMATDGAEPVGSTAAEFSALIKRDMEKWSAVAKKAGIQPE
jgi:tripartite-type tricarboxylate transporter receptor subunit TctC